MNKENVDLDNNEAPDDMTGNENAQETPANGNPRPESGFSDEVIKENSGSAGEQTPEDTRNTPDASQEVSGIRQTANEIMEIITQNELIENAKHEKVLRILKSQTKLQKQKTEIIERLEKERQVLVKKRNLLKKALKKAKEVKLGKSRIVLIRTDFNLTKEALRHCKSMIKEEKSNIKNIEGIIALLDSEN